MKASYAIARIAANELRHSLRNRSLLIACVGVTALLLLSAFVARQNQAKLNAQRNEYQQRVRANWLEQPDRHPHRASHYGYLAFRPKAALSFFDPGVDSFAGTSIFLEPHRQNTANFSEARHSGGMLRFGELSPALVLQLLAPLAIFFLGFAAITGERESGTLPVLLAQGVTWRELIAGKTLGVAAMALLVIAFTHNTLSAEREQGVWDLVCSQPASPRKILAIKAGLRFSAIAGGWLLTLLAAVVWLRLPLDRRLGFIALVSLSYLLFWFTASLLVMSFKHLCHAVPRQIESATTTAPMFSSLIASIKLCALGAGLKVGGGPMVVGSEGWPEGWPGFGINSVRFARRSASRISAAVAGRSSGLSDAARRRIADTSTGISGLISCAGRSGSDLPSSTSIFRVNAYGGGCPVSR